MQGNTGAAGPSLRVLDANDATLGYALGASPAFTVTLWDDVNDVIWSADVRTGQLVSNVDTPYYTDSGCSQLVLVGIGNGFGDLARQPLRGAQIAAYVARGATTQVNTIYQQSDTGCLATSEGPYLVTPAVALSAVPSFTAPLRVGFPLTR